ncbi:MAG: DUF192 domain-containing protein [Candidatus Cloacimonadaceae bacterium]
MIRLYIGIGFIIIAVVALLLIMLLPDNITDKNDSVSQYIFEKHGTASFFDKTGAELCSFDIEIAESLEKQTIGLMYRDSLAANQAMLFPYPDDDIRIFWMKNTYLPLDIIFIAGDSTIVSITKNTTPFDETGMQSKAPARFVLEVNAGISDRFNLQPGHKFSYTRDINQTKE